MKNRIFSFNHMILLAVVGIFALAACSKSFLNQAPYDGISPQRAVTNEADMYTALMGLYSSLRATDFYGRTYAVKGDLMSDNCFLSSQNSGRYIPFNLYNMDKANSYPSSVWQNAYAAIKNANLIINSGVANNSDNISQLLGEAYAVRGLIYFDLARNFSVPYAVGGSNPGVPIVLKFDSTAKPMRDSLGKVYAQALSDLNTAYSFMKYDQGAVMSFTTVSGLSRSMNSSYMTKYAIGGLLARVYQHMGNWAAARDAALDVVNNGKYSLIASTGLVGYWLGAIPRTDKVETMFEVTSDANNSVADGTLANLYVPKALGGSYGDILATKALYDSYGATDVRKLLYNPSTRSGQLGKAYYITKYPIDNVNVDDVKIVRYAEVILILAEAYYNLGDEANALKYVNMVAQKRDPSFTGYTTTGTAVLESILAERQKELAFEGYRFWDLYRLQRSFVKPQAQDATNTIISSITVTFPTPGNTAGYTSNVIFPIPFDEIQVNPGLGTQQNWGY